MISIDWTWALIILVIAVFVALGLANIMGGGSFSGLDAIFGLFRGA